MSVRRREDRLALIERDDGHPEDIVEVAISPYGRQSSYHDPDANCLGLKNATNTQEITRKHAQRKTCPPCRNCILDDSPDTGNDRSVYETLHDDDVTDFDAVRERLEADDGDE